MSKKGDVTLLIITVLMGKLQAWLDPGIQITIGLPLHLFAAFSALLVYTQHALFLGQAVLGLCFSLQLSTSGK